MTESKKTIATSFLTENRTQADESAVKIIGPKLVGDLMRIFKTSEIFSIEHNQTREAAQTFTTWLNESLVKYKEERFTIQLTDNNVFINGQLIKFEESQYSRSVLIRSTFLVYSINQISFEAGIAPGEVIALLQAVDGVRKKQSTSLESFLSPKLKLQAVGHKDLDDFVDQDERREIIELYAGLVIKCAAYFHQLQRTNNASARFIKRLIQKCADKFVTHRHVFIGLINLRLITGQDFVHAVNTAFYGMFIGQELQLDRRDLVRIGMTAITQDIHRIRQRFSEDEEIEIGQKSHFKTNMTSVTMLSEMGAADLLSALRLVMSYERGFPYNKPLPDEWYKEEMRPHLLSRIVEIARHYDVLTQGMEGQKALKSDMALQAISGQMGRHYDPQLTKLFINLVGIYPVGEVVLLSTGEQAVVIRSPTLAEENSNRSLAHRPTVRYMDGSERIVDLSAEENHSIRVVKIVDAEDVQEQPGAFFFF